MITKIWVKSIQIQKYEIKIEFIILIKIPNIHPKIDFFKNIWFFLKVITILMFFIEKHLLHIT